MEVLLGITGAVIGSFLNVCIYRIPRGQSLIRPGSRCPSCLTPIPFYLNVPILSYVMLRGRCHACRRPIPSRYPLVEIISTALTLATYWRFGLTAPFFFYLIFIYFLIVISFIDLDTQLIHNRLLLALLISGVALNAVLAVHPWKESFLGLLVGGGTLLACAILGKLLFHKDALGMGDVKLAAVAGFFLGWKMGMYALGFSFFLTLILLILALPFTRWRWGQYIPFGPFLALGWIIFVYWGSQLVRWYWQYLIVYPG